MGDEELTNFVKQIFSEYGVDPPSIGFEITETAAISHFTHAVAFVKEMRAMGCRVALDDFGSGLSSFGYLKAFPIDLLKIDQLFIRKMASNPSDRAMVKAIHQIGTVYGLRCVAEGVEDEGTLQHLREIGVDFVQGYVIHRPEPWGE